MAPGLRADADDSFSRTFGEIEFAISELLSQQTLDAELADVFDAIDRHSRADMSRVLSVDVAGDLPAGMANDFVSRNVELIRTAGLGQVREMRDLVIRATQEQISYGDLSAQIQHQYQIAESRANLIARDQVLKANADLGRVRAQAAGVTRYIWSTAKDERVRGTPGGRWPKGMHYSLDGTVHDWNDPPVVNAKTQRKEHPGRDYQCRCVAIPMVDDLLYGEDYRRISIS